MAKNLEQLQQEHYEELERQEQERLNAPEEENYEIQDPCEYCEEVEAEIEEICRSKKDEKKLISTRCCRRCRNEGIVENGEIHDHWSWMRIEEIKIIR